VSRKSKFRIGIGSPEAPFAGAWVFWTNRYDAYCTNRTIGGALKISLHQRYWGIHMESRVTIPGLNRRVVEKWQPPAEVRGIVRGPTITIPRDYGVYDCPPFAPHDVEGVDAWVAAPKPGHAVSFYVLLSRQASVPPGAPPTAVASLPLLDGRHMIVLSDEGKLDDQGMATLKWLRAEAPVFDVKGSSPEDRFHASLFHVPVGRGSAFPQITQFVLNSRNVRRLP
jgi:hypothetical protein